MIMTLELDLATSIKLPYMENDGSARQANHVGERWRKQGKRAKPSMWRKEKVQ